jgi:hypothetical protein
MATALALLGISIITLLRILTQTSDDFNKPAPLLEALSFYLVIYYSFRTLFAVNQFSPCLGTFRACMCFALYLTIPLLEWVVPTGGNSETYPSPDHVFFNWLTAYIYHSDLGFWQIARTFACSGLVLWCLLHNGVPRGRAVACNLIIYSVLILYTHAELWQFLPNHGVALPPDYAEKYLLSLRPVAYNLLLLCILLGYVGFGRFYSETLVDSLKWGINLVISSFVFSLLIPYQPGYVPFLLMLFSLALNYLLNHVARSRGVAPIERAVMLLMVATLAFSGTWCRSGFFLVVGFQFLSNARHRYLKHFTPVICALILSLVA